MAENNVILQVQDVTMQFGGLRAIDNVSFHVDEAEIFGLIGPNGAGKTTLFNVITANYKPTSGSVTLAGTSLKGLKPNQVVNAGIARTFQNIRLFNSMTVLENVMVGLDRASRYSLLEAARIDGAGEARIFFQIVLPIMRPSVISVAILQAMWIWNDFLLPLITLTDQSNQTIPLAQYVFQSQFTSNYPMAFASYLMAMAPVLIVYIFAQKWVVGGVMRGAVK